MDDEQGYPHGLDTSIDVLFKVPLVDFSDLNELALLQ